MPNRDLSYRISFDVDASDLSSATSDIDALTSALDSVGSDTISVDVEVDEGAVQEIEDITEAFDKLDSETVTATVEVDGSERSIADVMELQEQLDNFDKDEFIVEMKVELDQARADVIRFASELEELEGFDLPGVREGVQSQFAEASARVEGLEQDLRDLGVALRSVDDGASLDGIGASADRAAAGVAGIRDGADRAAAGLDRVRNSSEQSRSVLANFSGNAAQDLGQLSGVAGSAGVAIGQLAEYAVDGNIALSNLAKTAGPMAGVAVAAALIGEKLKGIAAEKAFRADLVEDFTDALREGETAASALYDQLVETGRLEFQDTSTGILNLSTATQDLIPKLDAAGVSFEEFLQLVDESQATDSRDAVHQLLLELGDLSELDADDITDILDAVEQYADSFEVAAAATGALNNVLKLTPQVVQDSFGAFREARDFTLGYNDAWDELIRFLAEGGRATEDTAAAMELLTKASGKSKDEILAIVQSKLDERLELIADAAELAGGLIGDMGEAVQDANAEIADFAGGVLSDGADAALEMAAAIKKLTEAAAGLAGGTIGDVADQLEAIGQTSGEFGGGLLAGVADAAIEARDHLVEVAQASASINEILSATPDLANALSTALSGSDLLFEGLAFDIDFETSFQEALEGLQGFEPDLQTIADSWSDILNGVEIDIFGNVRADDAEFLDKLSGLRDLFQEGVVNEFEQGGIDAAQAFVESSAQAIAESTGISIEDVYRLMGLPADGSVQALVQPTIDADNAAKARGILDAISGTGSTDPRIAEIQVQLLTGEITPEEALAAALVVYQDFVDANPIALKIEPPTINGEGHGLREGDIPEVTVNVEPNTVPFDTAMSTLLAANREATVNAILGTYPTSGQIIAAVTGGAGAIRIPVDYYVRSAPRIDGVRTQAV